MDSDRKDLIFRNSPSRIRSERHALGNTVGRSSDRIVYITEVENRVSLGTLDIVARTNADLPDETGLVSTDTTVEER
jgi:hypothetical protein